MDDVSKLDRPNRARGLEDAAMPPEVPRAMPSQSLRWFDRSSHRAPAGSRSARSPAWRKVVVLGASLALAAYAIAEMWRALSVSHLTVVGAVVLVLFAVNFTWISVPLVTSTIGLLRVVARRRTALPAGGALTTRTALLMPCHDEDPASMAAALEAMARDLVARREGHSFDLFLLSDTTDGDLALAEEEAFGTLRRRVGGSIQVFYRRRAENVAHKPGNIRDFCERWGGAYDHLVVLDADSLVDGATLVALARRMEADPDAGLIQTLPRLHRGTTLLARVQQFAGSVHGALLGEGLAWWAASEATFWGHNAIIRTEAFTACAGLPVLPGAPPFGGPILSHDFVEAALLRRGNWKVSIAPDLEGSYEEGPSSLVDLAIRDRRWCQGNLQHARVLTARGLHWASRLNLVGGIMSYLASPLWLLFVISALVLGVEYESARQQYFSHAPSLFPLWPRIDPDRAVRLFVLTMSVLFGPKVLGWLSVVLRPSRLRERGGLVRVTCGLALEVVLLALVAPVQALVHCGIVADVLRGRSSGWRGQRREGTSLPWSAALHAHRWHVLAGAALALAAWSISWQMLAWLAPAVVGMILAAPLSKLLASTGVGRAVRRAGLLVTPEETRTPDIVRAADHLLPTYRAALDETPDLATVVRDARLLDRHLALVDRGAGLADPFDPLEALAEKKIREARTVAEAIALLTPQERGRVLARPSLLRLVATVRERTERKRAARGVAVPWWRSARPFPDPDGDVSRL